MLVPARRRHPSRQLEVHHNSRPARGQQSSEVGVRGVQSRATSSLIDRFVAEHHTHALSPWSAYRGDHGCGDASKGHLARLLESGVNDDLLAAGAASRQRTSACQGWVRGIQENYETVKPSEMRTMGRGPLTGPSLPAWASAPASSLPWAPAWSASFKSCSAQIHAGSYRFLSGEILNPASLNETLVDV